MGTGNDETWTSYLSRRPAASSTFHFGIPASAPISSLDDCADIITTRSWVFFSDRGTLKSDQTKAYDGSDVYVRFVAELADSFLRHLRGEAECRPERSAGNGGDTARDQDC